MCPPGTADTLLDVRHLNYESPYLELIIPGFILFAVAVRLVAGSFDRTRIENDINEQGGILQSCSWHPFGKGWFGSRHERIYRVVYTDRSGNRHDAVCKTGVLAGVYFTEDSLMGTSSGLPDRSESLQEENARLRAEVEYYKNKSA